MDLSFLFLDDCLSDPLDREGTRISSLTGLLVPAELYAVLRSRFYEAIAWSISPDARAINLNPPELHGCDLLRGEDDKRKLDVLGRIVDLVIGGGLSVYRVGYYVTKSLRDAFADDKNMLGVCWAGMLTVLQPVLARSAIIPIMDMGDPKLVRSLSSQVQTMDVMRAAGVADAIDVAGSSNLLGEVFYADSRFAVFIQVVDLISYLRHTGDMHREGRRLSPFRSQLRDLSRRLTPVIVRDEIIAMTMNGEVQRPAYPKSS